MPVTWQGRLADFNEHLRSGFQQLADPPLDLPGSQARLPNRPRARVCVSRHRLNAATGLATEQWLSAACWMTLRWTFQDLRCSCPGPVHS